MIIPQDCSPSFLQKVILGEVKYGAITNETLKTMIAPLLNHFDLDVVTKIINNICYHSNQTTTAMNNTPPNITTSGYENNERIHLESQQLTENECYESR